jgi:transcriptional regulator with XRE-family HTH domain
MNAEAVRAILRSLVRLEGNQKRLAGKLGISPSMLCAVLAGKKEPAGRILEYLNLTRVKRWDYFVRNAHAPHLEELAERMASRRRE